VATQPFALASLAFRVFLALAHSQMKALYVYVYARASQSLMKKTYIAVVLVRELWEL